MHLSHYTCKYKRLFKARLQGNGWLKLRRLLQMLMWHKDGISDQDCADFHFDLIVNIKSVQSKHNMNKEVH